MAYLSVISWLNRKKIGYDVAVLFTIFNVAPFIGVLIANFTKLDFSYVFSAVTLAFVTEFIQEKEINEQEKRNKHSLMV